LALLLATLPFELYEGVPIAGLTFTHVELLTLAVLGAWAMLLVAERRRPCSSRGLVFPAVALLAVFFVSAAAAPAWRGEPPKYTARQAQGALLALCVADQISRAGWLLARRLGLALVAGASASAGLGLLELSEEPAMLAMLAPFKERPTLVGGMLRLSATFGYANIAAMYYEAALPAALAAAGLAGGRAGRWLALAAPLLYIAALLTYSRAALLVATATALIVALVALWAALRRPRADAQAPPSRQAAILAAESNARRFLWPLWLKRTALCYRRLSAGRADDAPLWRMAGLGVVLLAAAAGLLIASPAYRVRLTSPDVDRWFRAEYVVAPLPALAPNSSAYTPVTMVNRGLVAWDPGGLRPVALSYHWLDARTRLVVRYNGSRTPLPHSVAPGDMITLDAMVHAPTQPGAYILAWDMVAEHVGWFSVRGAQVAEVAVSVAGTPEASQPAPPPEPSTMPRRIEPRPAPPERSQLWSAALRLWRARPLLGIGPDVFRHVYGPELGLSSWDDRIHTNNLYLEILAGAGIAGMAAFLALVGSALVSGRRALARFDRTANQWWVALVCSAGLAAYLIHGTLDMFLEYSATYLLFWALLGALHTRASAET
jgi:hypothetical protein